MLTVLLSSMTAAAMLVMLLSLSPLPLPLRSPCRCGRAHRNAARRSPVQPPCSPSRHAAVAVPAAAMPAVLRSLCRAPLCPPYCARCAGRRYARRAAVAHAGRRHACRAALAVPAAAMLVMLLSLSPLPLRSP
ncbi:hypothetical protein PF007_g29828 [Phytophthora fragariae]|uniref:Uncharacterized protein n=1 Tax=Phytophthora fragariae TaxID=53985 RepID=A0A6A3PP74_9STRA|nr:hypothetical protein PF007_g29828 [Phytophthora fragariae]